MVTLTINGKTVCVPEGTSILDAARAANIDIPTLCYLKDLNEIGACRICMVEVEGQETLVAACDNEVHAGMVIHTNSQKVRMTRRVNLQLLLSQHEVNCVKCTRSGNCKLQPYFADYLGDVKDADAMVFDAFSNPDAKMIEERLIPFIERIRAKLPSTPLIFVQTIYRESGNFDLRSRKIEEDKRDMARRQMAEAMKRFDNVYFVDKADLTGTDHVTSADGTHPSDLGYWRWAQNLQPELLKVFRKCGIR